jgi:hypothetical protein
MRSKFNIPTIFLLMLLIFGCADRQKNATESTSGTFRFTSKSMNGIEGEIQFYRKKGPKTGRLLGEGSTFEISENGKVRALIQLENWEHNRTKELMFHLDWIGANGKSFFQKRIDLLPSDSSNFLSSSISITPEKRDTGVYQLRVYLFRELIAMKTFDLIAELPNKISTEEMLNASVRLAKKVNRKTGQLLDEGSVFTIQAKKKITALLDCQRYVHSDELDHKFKFRWISPNDSLLFSKNLRLDFDDTLSQIRSSFSISPKKRLPGNHKCVVFYRGEFIAEKSFELIEAPTIVEMRTEAPKIAITLYRKKSKKSGKRIGEATFFNIEENGKVRAQLVIENEAKFRKNLQFQLKWIGPDGKSFYTKRVTLAAGESDSIIESSISATPDKRSPGAYMLKVYYRDEAIAVKKFTLK